jgi:hypothetical protein
MYVCVCVCACACVEKQCYVRLASCSWVAGGSEMRPSPCSRRFARAVEPAAVSTEQECYTNTNTNKHRERERERAHPGEELAQSRVVRVLAVPHRPRTLHVLGVLLRQTFGRVTHAYRIAGRTDTKKHAGQGKGRQNYAKKYRCRAPSAEDCASCQ